MTTRFLPVLFVLAVAALFCAPFAEAGALSNVDFKIKKGRHSDSSRGTYPRCMSFKKDRTVTFQVLFTSSTNYRTRSASNQSDNNKVMGLTTTRIHHNSIRLGWSFNPTTSRMRLRFFGYARGTRISRHLTEVPLNQWITVTLRMHKNGLMAEANGARFEHNGSLGFSSWFPTASWMLKTAFFGGDETAPHEMVVRARNIRLQSR